MKILSVRFDPGTMSAPAFLDLILEDNTVVTFQGKAARKAKDKYKEGDDYDTAS